VAPGVLQRDPPLVVVQALIAGRDGNKLGRPTGAYGLAYDRSDQARLFS
jgi:hypothetical protein